MTPRSRATRKIISEKGPTTFYPLPSHTQLRITRTRLASSVSGDDEVDADWHIEYRVDNWKRLPSGRILRGDTLPTGLTVLTVLTIFWGLVYGGSKGGGLLKHGICIAVIIVWSVWASRTVLYQSVVPLPGLGIQLSTTRGISIPSLRNIAANRISIPLGTTHTFIPLRDIATVVINEGLSRWNVRFYLAVIKKRGQGVVVAFDSVHQPIPVLKEVYHGIREILYDEYNDTASERYT